MKKPYTPTWLTRKLTEWEESLKEVPARDLGFQLFYVFFAGIGTFLTAFFLGMFGIGVALGLFNQASWTSIGLGVVVLWVSGCWIGLTSFFGFSVMSVVVSVLSRR